MLIVAIVIKAHLSSYLNATLASLANYVLNPKNARNALLINFVYDIFIKVKVKFPGMRYGWHKMFW